MALPPLRRRLLYALLPLALLLVGVEVISAVVAERVLASRTPTGFVNMPMPRRAGMVDREAELTVACVGDSWTFGWGVEDDETWPSQLGAALPQARVVNLGNPGASPIKAARTLTTWLGEEDTELVIYLAGSNTPMNRVTLEDRRAPAPLRTLRPALRRLATYRLLSQLIARARLKADTHLQVWDKETEQQRTPPTEKGAWMAAAMASTQANMARMADLSAAFDVELLVLTYGLPTSLEAHRGEGWYRFPELNETIRQAAADNGLPVLDIEAVYAHRGLDTEVLYFGAERLSSRTLDIHPNAAGYAVYAEEIARWIDDNGLL